MTRLGATNNADFVKNILIVFTAPYIDGGTYIIGWYKNATFFKNYQSSDLLERKFRDEIKRYITMADVEDTTLLSIDERFSFPSIPRRVKGGMGQSNIWYADSPEMVKFKNEVQEYIENYDDKKKKKNESVVIRQIDHELRKNIETIAVSLVTNEFSKRGFEVRSVESKNLGWDLEAVFKKTILKIKVKGISGNKISLELTQNEYENMHKYKDTYRLCILLGGFEDPKLFIFSFSKEKNNWISEEDHILYVDQIISARCFT